ncbi:tRNA (adenosine(37)-N6)-threonylcarbamoyltransferase complex dimerization subunit type 1 TsaB [Haliea sp.]|uniref:tRNA (adenosine(37)-N6)-threonylcarbamoyltransferase complex dimerization subunit type 1 TsaB n=1 Tax=Haliea sp. TaxID=1932666 RepID=UPI0035298B29
MTSILAIDTSTDACSVALWDSNTVRVLLEHAPRRHNQLLLGMLRELLPQGPGNLDAVAYGCGPGSFTGLRITASAAQGICYAAQLPALPVSTLAAQVQSAIRLGLAGEGDWVLSTLDAHIGELYWGLYRVVDGLPQAASAASACHPGELALPVNESLVAVGSGLHYADQIPDTCRARFSAVHTELLPSAEDILPLAQHAFLAGEWQPAEAVCPVYVRDEVRWKKLAEQGPRS